MKCSVEGCNRSRIYAVDPDGSPWHLKGETIGSPMKDLKPLKFCYFHHKKELGLFNVDRETYLSNHSKGDLSCPWISR